MSAPADEIRESDIGRGAGLFEVRKIGDEFYTFIVDCKVWRLPACLPTCLPALKAGFATALVVLVFQC